MSLNVSKAFSTAYSVLNQNLGKYDILNIVGMGADNNLIYLQQGITKGFYYKKASIGQGNIIETINIVPESPTIDDSLKKVIMLELVTLDGVFTRFTVESKKPPQRPSFQWVFN